MTAILLSAIPKYLHNSAFYISLDIGKGDSDSITIPDDCIKDNDTVEKPQDLHSLLLTVRFWGASVIPMNILKFILSSKDDPVVAVSEFYEDFPIIQCAVDIQQCQLSSRMRKAIESGHLPIVECLHTTDYPWDGVFKSVTSVQPSASFAAKLGHVHILKYIHTNGGTWDKSTTLAAARYGHLSCLQYLHEQGCVWDDQCCGVAANGGHLDCLRFCHTHGAKLTAFAADYAAMNGHLHCIKYIVECGFDLSFGVIEYALLYGHRACFQYAHETGTVVLEDPESEPLSYYNMLTNALTNGKLNEEGMLECMQYAVRVGYTALIVHLGLVLNIISFGMVDCLRYYREHVLNESFLPHVAAHAAQNGQLACLRYITETESARHNMVTHVAICSGHYDCLIYAYEQGYPWLQSELHLVYPRADAQRGQLLKCFEYALIRGCICTDSWVSLSCAYGQLDALQFAVQHGANSTYNDVFYALQGANVHCVEYLHTISWVDVQDTYYGTHIFSAQVGPCLHYLATHFVLNGMLARDMAVWAVQYDDVSLLSLLCELGAVLPEMATALGCNAWTCVKYLYEQGEVPMNDAEIAACQRVVKLNT